MGNKAERQVEIQNIFDKHHELGMPIVKANALIQKSRYSLSLQEQKIILYIMSKIEPNDDDFKYYEFYLKDLCDLCDIEYYGANYQNFKDSIQSLSDKSFWIDTGTQEILLRWVDTVIIDKVENAKVYIRINEKLKPYLLHLKSNYTIYELSSTLLMKSKYSIRFYELLKSYLYKNKWEISLEELKRILSIEDKYTDYKNFRTRIIDKAIEEINKYTEINVEYEPIRTSRTITHLHFAICRKSPEELSESVISRAEERKSRKG